VSGIPVCIAAASRARSCNSRGKSRFSPWETPSRKEALQVADSHLEVQWVYL